jgi:hypothetical protein
MEKHMPYVTSIERLGEEKGLKKGREEGFQKGREAVRRDLLKVIATGLGQKFGNLGKRLASRVRKVDDIARLLRIAQILITATTIDELEAALVDDP